MDDDKPNNRTARKTVKKALPKPQVFRDVPSTPTTREIEQSISLGKTLTLMEFVKGVKL